MPVDSSVMTAKGVTSEPVILLMIWANTSRMMTCGLPWPMPWTTSLEIARTAIFSKFSNATESRWHFLTTNLLLILNSNQNFKKDFNCLKGMEFI